MTRKLNSIKLHFKKFCHTKTVSVRANLVTYFKSAWKSKKKKAQISFHMTEIEFIGVIETVDVLWY